MTRNFFTNPMKRLIFAVNSEFRNEASMKCSHCGSPCSDDAKFCSTCGNILDGIPYSPAASATSTKTFQSIRINDKFPETHPKHQNMKPWLLFWIPIATTAISFTFIQIFRYVGLFQPAPIRGKFNNLHTIHNILSSRSQCIYLFSQDKKEIKSQSI